MHDECKDVLDTGYPLAQNGTSLALFCTNGAHPSYINGLV